METILVTGASGWLGSRFVYSLLHGFECSKLKLNSGPWSRIRCMVPPSQERASLHTSVSAVEVVAGDLRNISDCESFCENSDRATLFHLAGVIHPRRVREFYEVNVEGTRNILNAAARSGVRRAVVVSSNSPFGFNQGTDRLFDEDSPYNPYRNYGRSKMLMEQVALEIGKKFSMTTVLVRAPWFYGPFQPPRQTLFFQMIRDGKCPVVGDGKNLRSMAYVDNLCQGLMLAAVTEGVDGKAYWIADERPYSMNEIIHTVEDVMEKDFRIPCAHRYIKIPDFVAGTAGFLDAVIQGSGFYHQKIHVLSEMNKNIACSIQRAREELGYHPTVDLREGMKRSVQWCLENSLL